jgi:urocanate hydratase
VVLGYSQHSGWVFCADVPYWAKKRLERVLVNDCGSGVMRHADAGYETAVDCAKRNGLNLPMIK